MRAVRVPSQAERSRRQSGELLLSRGLDRHGQDLLVAEGFEQGLASARSVLLRGR